jgi:hypothetical protein
VCHSSKTRSWNELECVGKIRMSPVDNILAIAASFSDAGLVTIANERRPRNRWWVIDFEPQTPEPDRSISGMQEYDDGLFTF